MIYVWYLVGIWSGLEAGKKVEILKVLRMNFSIVENLSGPQESVSGLFRRPQLGVEERGRSTGNKQVSH